MEEKQYSARSVLLAVCAAQFFLPFMMAGVNAVLPPIGMDTGASARELSLITTYYTLGLAIFQLTAGRMGDVWGRRYIFLWGMGIFASMAALIGFLDNALAIQVLRFVQGAGAAMFNASGLAILVSAAPAGMRGQYIGLSGAAVYAGIACGPPVAGLIAGVVGWRWLFWGSAAAGVLAWCLMYLTVRTEWYGGKGEPFDWRGGLVYGAAMAAFTIGSTVLQQTMGLGWAIMLAGLAIMALYVWMEMHTAYPLLDVRLLVRNKVFGLSSLAAFISYASSFGLLLYFSLYLQEVRGFSVQDAGLFLSTQFLVQAVTTPWAARMADKHGAGRISAIGIGLCGFGIVACAFLGENTSLWFLVLAQFFLGLGVSLFAVPNTTVLLESAGPEHLGQAAGLTGAVRTGGGLFNAIIISTTLGHFLGDAPVSHDTIGPFLQSMRVDLLFFGLLNVAAIGCALGRQSALRKEQG